MIVLIFVCQIIFPIEVSIPLFHVDFGLPHFLLSDGIKFKNRYGLIPSFIMYTKGLSFAFFHPSRNSVSVHTMVVVLSNYIYTFQGIPKVLLH